MRDIINEFNEDDKVFAYDAVNYAKENKGKINDILINDLENLIKNAKKYENEKYPISALYSMYLLAEFRDERLYPLIIEIINNKEIDEKAFFGDIITEDLKSIIVSVFNNDFDSLNSIIENKDMNKYIRGALLNCYIYFYDNKMIEKNSLEKYLRKLIKLYGDNYDMIFDYINDVVINTHMFSMIDDIKTLFRKGLIYIHMRGDYTDFLDDIFDYSNNIDKFGPIEDTIKSMSWWAWFANSSPKINEQQIENNFNNYILEQKNKLIKKVGRNEPCPCGSGKKYKKCCLINDEKLLPYQFFINESLKNYPKRKTDSASYDIYDFYKEEYIELDKILYKALKKINIPYFIERDMNKENKINLEYLEEAYSIIKKVINKNRFKTIEEYDKEVAVHFSLYEFYNKYTKILLDFIKDNYNKKKEYLEKLEEVTEFFNNSFNIENNDNEVIFIDRKTNIFLIKENYNEGIEYFKERLKKCSDNTKYDIYESLFYLYSYVDDIKSIEDLIDKETDKNLKESLEELKLDIIE